MTRSASAPRRFPGRVVLVTGASGGQGEVEARLFAAEGAEVIVADVLVEQGRQVADDLVAGGASARFVELDVADEAAWTRVVGEIDRDLGRLDVLVNNAGISDRRGVVEQDPAAFSRVVDINLWGPVAGMRACAPLMARTGGGSIVNIVSIAGLTGYDAAGYTASKWGLRGVSRTAALELAASGIRVNSVMPGVILTPMVSDASDEAIASFAGLCAIPRAGLAEEIAHTVLHLASDESAYTIGAEVTIDGGFTAAGPQRAVDSLAPRYAKEPRRG